MGRGGCIGAVKESTVLGISVGSSLRHQLKRRDEQRKPRGTAGTLADREVVPTERPGRDAVSWIVAISTPNSDGMDQLTQRAIGNGDG